MYIAEWSVVKDIGEAKLHPFFFFSIQETTDPYQVIPPSLTRQGESAKWSTEYMYLWDRNFHGKKFSNEIYLLFNDRLFHRGTRNCTIIIVDIPGGQAFVGQRNSFEIVIFLNHQNNIALSLNVLRVNLFSLLYFEIRKYDKLPEKLIHNQFKDYDHSEFISLLIILLKLKQNRNPLFVLIKCASKS